MIPRGAGSVLVAAGLLSAPRLAGAHLVSTGVGPFYDGAAHLFVSIEELLPVLALSLLAGLRGPRAGRWMVAVLSAAWLAGGVAGSTASMAAPPPLVATALLLIPGALLAADWALPLSAVVGLAALVRAGAGVLSGGAMAAGPQGVAAVVGSASAALAVAVLGAALATSWRAGWAAIAMRVVGSWVAALGLLALGWALRS